MPAGSRAISLDQATHNSREHRRPIGRLLADRLLRPQPTRRQVVEVEIDTRATIGEAYLEAAGARNGFVLKKTDGHGGHQKSGAGGCQIVDYWWLGMRASYCASCVWQFFR